jgi:replicative DNA helicase
MADERGKKGDTKATALTNISEDLMNLSIEIGVPIVVVVQANRNGAGLDDEETPELEHMRDSDGIAFNASKVISLKHSKEDNVLTLQVKKQRNGLIGTKVRYIYNINTGEFIPMANNAGIKEKRKIDKKEDVF